MCVCVYASHTTCCLFAHHRTSGAVFPGSTEEVPYPKVQRDFRVNFDGTVEVHHSKHRCLCIVEFIPQSFHKVEHGEVITPLMVPDNDENEDMFVDARSAGSPEGYASPQLLPLLYAYLFVQKTKQLVDNVRQRWLGPRRVCMERSRSGTSDQLMDRMMVEQMCPGSTPAQQSVLIHSLLCLFSVV